METKDLTESDSYESKEEAVNRYNTSKNGEREVILYGNQNKPVEILVNETTIGKRTFIKFGDAEVLVAGGNEDDDVDNSLRENIKLFPTIPQKYEDVHVSRLELNNIVDKFAIPRSYFVVTGRIKPQ